jgi:MFS family permease
MTTADCMPRGLVGESHASSRQSLRGLDWLNLFLAGAFTGFGPFVPLYLAGRDWTQGEIGFALTVSAITGLLTQVPGGKLLDVVRSKRTVVGLGIATIGCAAVILAFRTSLTPVLIVEVLVGVASGFLGPAVAAISLGLVGSDRLPERLGRNQRFAAIGGLATAGVMGLLGYLLSSQAIFLVTAALTFPTLIALGRIRARDIRFTISPNHQSGDCPPARPRTTARFAASTKDRLFVFAGCIVLFQMANASVLTLLAEKSNHASSLVISVLVFIPQIVVAVLAPWVGRSARNWGRRPLLLIGLAALPVRAVCFALTDDPVSLAAIQMLDGISAAVIGVMTPLVIADIMNGTELFNFGQGVVGTFSGIGAALSTTVSGYVAQTFGNAAAFYTIMGVALTAVAVCWAFMSETKGTPPTTKANTRILCDERSIVGHSGEQRSDIGRGGGMNPVYRCRSDEPRAGCIYRIPLGVVPSGTRRRSLQLIWATRAQ